jgi:hypothetical protein
MMRWQGMMMAMGFAAVGRAHSPCQVRISKAMGEVAIGGGAAEGQLLQFRPYLLLELRALRGQRQIELSQLPREISLKLPNTFGNEWAR